MNRCDYGFHIWRYNVSETYDENQTQDGVVEDYYCVVCDIDYDDYLREEETC